MMAAKVIFIVVAGLVSPAVSETARANPIRKVVTMLQAMQKQVEREGVKEKAMFEKFMCYCKNSGGDLKASIAAAETKAPNVGSDIREAEEKKVQLDVDVKHHQSDRASAKNAIAEAKALRTKAAGEFGKVKADHEANIAALAKAIAAIEKGMAGAFLQTQAADVIRKIAQSATQTMLEADKEEVLAFLSGGSQYAPQSGEIVGILKQMMESFQKDLADASGEEGDAIASFKQLVAAKTKEVKVSTTAIEIKLQRSGDLAVKIVQMKDDLSATEAALLQDKQFLADLEKNCATKAAEWDEICKIRSEELVALAETIKILNDDDALELFKKTLPSASAAFMQLTASTAAIREQALKILHSGAVKSDVNLNFIALALSGKKIGFDRVIKMIDDLVALLKQEQLDDNDKKEYCGKQFDVQDDNKKTLERGVSDADAAIAVAQENIAQLKADIKSLKDGIATLDNSVAEQTQQRKDENSDYKDLKAADSVAKEVLGFAKNRLNKFYNPKLYIAPPKRQLSAEDRIVVGMGGDVPTNAPGGIAGTGISLVQTSRHEVAPPPAPETAKAYRKKQATGVIGMIDLLISDLDKELAESEQAEKDSQADYEQAMADAAAKRANDAKALGSKVGALADENASLQGHQGDHNAKSSELMATNQVIAGLHAECDWLVKYFDARKAARDGEIDSLQKAKAVLGGADYSLVQIRKSLRSRS